MKYDAIYFDLDGTLWDATDVSLDCANVVSKKYNLDLISRAAIEQTMGKTQEECVEIVYPNLPYNEGLAYLDEVMELTTQRLKTQGGKVYEGLEETLKELINRNYKLGIVSNCLAGYIEAFMISSGLGKYFNDIVAAGKKEIKKSDAIKLAIERDGVRNAIYVGDTTKDKEAAEGAGLEFIHAKYGFEKDLYSEYSINSIKELPNFMSKIDS